MPTDVEQWIHKSHTMRIVFFNERKTCEWPIFDYDIRSDAIHFLQIQIKPYRIYEFLTNHTNEFVSSGLSVLNLNESGY